MEFIDAKSELPQMRHYVGFLTLNRVTYTIADLRKLRRVTEIY